MRRVAAALKVLAKFRTTPRHHNLFAADRGIAAEVHRFFGRHFQQRPNMSPDGAPPLLIKGLWMPDGPAVRQRTEASVQMIKPVLHQLD